MASFGQKVMGIPMSIRHLHRNQHNGGLTRTLQVAMGEDQGSATPHCFAVWLKLLAVWPTSQS